MSFFCIYTPIHVCPAGHVRQEIDQSNVIIKPNILYIFYYQPNRTQYYFPILGYVYGHL